MSKDSSLPGRLGLGKEDTKKAWQRKIYETGVDHSIVYMDGGEGGRAG